MSDEPADKKPMADGGESTDSGDDAEADQPAAEETDADTEPENATDESADGSSDLPAKSLDDRLDDAESDLEAAETESDLDDVEADLDAIEADLEDADLPEPDEDEDDEDAEDPRADLEAQLEELRDALEEARGPYAEDVVSDIEESKSTISDTRWTDRGEGEVAEAVEAFLGEAYGIIEADPDFDDGRDTGSDADTGNEAEGKEETTITDGGEDADETDSDGDGDENTDAETNDDGDTTDGDTDTDNGESADENGDEGEDDEDTEAFEPVDVSVGRDLDSLTAALESAIADIENANLDADEDEATISALLDATTDLESGVEDAQAFDDLTVREKLAYEGFYDVLGSENKKDFPPEWNAIKIYERMGEVEPILLAFDLLGSEFMEDHCIEAFGRMGAPEAFDVMHQRAQRRKKPPIEVLGKIGDDRALDTLHPYIDGDSDPGLQKVVLKAIGEIGSTESTQPVADRLVAENDEVRSRAARALGLIGDTRAIRPLADVLRDDESDSVRASAAWALTQIGTEHALDAASEYAEDRSFIVQSEAEWAARALGDGERSGDADVAGSERERTV
ncbi:phycocyanobilin lyase [Halobacteriales archaeon QS_8_65_32]|nr:MAG: phycocyanobilin lyase [Halobacteriales archaeon QS_8_65_32]